MDQFDCIVVGAGSAGCVLANRLTANPAHKVLLSVCQLRPFSRGEVVVESSDPMAYPKIYPNYLSDERDCTVATGGIKVARRIADAPALRNVDLIGTAVTILGIVALILTIV